jgi:hypothetical protein
MNLRSPNSLTQTSAETPLGNTQFFRDTPKNLRHCHVLARLTVEDSAILDEICPVRGCIIEPPDLTPEELDHAVRNGCHAAIVTPDTI